MWVVHAPKRGGYSEMLNGLEEFHLGRKDFEIYGFLTRCTCVTEKNEPASRFKLFKFGSLVATTPTEILRVDVYDFEDKQ